VSRLIGWVVVVAFAARVAIAAEAPKIEVTPASGSIAAPFHVVVSHVLPGSRVRLTARRPDVHGRYWTAVGEYFADADGRIDVSAAPSLGGSYEGVSAHGLWCSALPVAPDELKAYVADLPQHPERGTAPELDVKSAYTVELAASINGKVVATTTAERSYGAGPSVEEASTPEGMRGLFFPARAGAPRGIPVVVVAGSGGGLPQAQAALLAAAGHPALAQGIFGYKDLPSTLRGIPIETFRDGARWLRQRTSVRRVAIMGTSRGSEAAGLAASYFPEEFAAAVVLVPSHLTNGAFGTGVTEVEAAWTYDGKPLPADHGETDSNNADDSVHAKDPPGFVGTPYYLGTWSDPAVAETFGIPFERMRGPVLAIGGGADEMWPSFIGAEQIRRRLAGHGKADMVEMRIYLGAGHMVSRVGSGGPLSSFVFHPVAKDFESTGGLPNANCEGSYDAWQEVLLFLAKIKPR
jgi:BAAT / Acyl-CoA thioester hydrolase C terminal/Acyl-CoA thioester hydrolase/BAAT N-terminal region